MKLKILVTGAAGFIGSNLVDRLLKSGHTVIGIDNFNDYYDPEIKEKNIIDATKNSGFKLYRTDILDVDSVRKIFASEKVNIVVHLAARAGIRPSIENPAIYAHTNVSGTVNLLKLSCDFGVKKFVFGSSSSVYGNNKKLPFSEDCETDSILSPYGASKKSAEFFVESFYHTYGLSSIIFRFFTVYGKRGRPDMAPALFTNSIMNGLKIKQFGSGESSRDYTYIDDVVEAIIRGLEKKIGFEIINLGGNKPVLLKHFISLIESISGRKANINKMLSQTGDVENTWANIEKAKKILDWQPKTDITQGLRVYLGWLKKNT